VQEHQTEAGFAVSVAVVALMLRDDQLSMLLIKRSEEPFRGAWSLPGGFVRRGQEQPDESLEGAARRGFLEETGIELDAAYVAQLGAYGDPGRDPRGEVVTVAYLAVRPTSSRPKAGGDASHARWMHVSTVLEAGEGALAFDHDRILADGVQRTSELVESTALGVAFCPPWFTIPHLRRVYENLWDLPRDTLDAGNFHHRVMGLTGLLEPVSDGELAMKAEEDRAIERRLGMMPTLEEAPAGRGRPPKMFKRGPLIREHGAAVPLERPFTRPQGEAGAR
jgi:8-oxo-dGTP diphosphatase